jgi:hypothetical protein
MNAVQFAHISIVAKDWKLLSQFYMQMIFLTAGPSGNSPNRSQIWN